MIDANNFKEILTKYIATKYESKLAEFHDTFYDEFPYKIEELDEKSYVKNFMDWLIFEKKLPETGKTIVEEYIDENQELDESTKHKLIGTMKFICSEFVVLSKHGLSIKIKDIKTGAYYK